MIGNRWGWGGLAMITFARRSNALFLHHRRRHRVVALRGLGASKNLASPSAARSDDDDGGVPPSPAPAPRRRLPVAAFVDLDNVRPTTFGRSDARGLVRPLLEFGRLVNGAAPPPAAQGGDEDDRADGGGAATATATATTTIVQAFGNLSTRTWRGEEEKAREPLAILDQKFVPWDGSVAQTGFDGDGVLRCGVCGTKVVLTKKDRAKAGMDPKGLGASVRDDLPHLLHKLKVHMKVHDKEYLKRKRKAVIYRRPKSPWPTQKLALDDLIKKYESAQVGLKRLQAVRIDKSGKAVKRPTSRNDLFQVLRELGVRVFSADDVDRALILKAERWMMNVIRDFEGDEEDALAHKGVLVVYSKDQDFVELLDRAKTRGFVTVSATEETTQSRKLLRSSDVVLGPFRDGWSGASLAQLDSDVGDDIALADGIAGDREEEDGSRGFDVKEVSPSDPLSWLEMEQPSAKPASMQAMPVSLDGLNFMKERMVGAPDDCVSCVVHSDNTLRWDLSSGLDEAADETNHSVLKDDAPGAEPVPSPTKQKRQMNPLPEIYKAASATNSDEPKEARGDGVGPKLLDEDTARKEISAKSKQLWGGSVKNKRLKKLWGGVLQTKYKDITIWRYQCKGCGKRVKNWGHFETHMRKCDSCTEDIRSMPRKEHIVHLDPATCDDYYGEREKLYIPPNVSGGNRIHHVLKVYGEYLPHLTPVERKAWARSLVKERKYFECKKCYDHEKHWSQFLERVRDCPHCGRKYSRKFGRANKKRPFEFYMIEEEQEEEEQQEEEEEEEAECDTSAIQILQKPISQTQD